MEKAKADNHMYTTRTGNHSTKPSAKGDTKLDHGVALIQRESLLEERASLVNQVQALTEEVQALNTKLRITLPFEEYKAASDRKAEVGLAIQTLQQKLAGINGKLLTVQAAGEDVWAKVFVQVANIYLPVDVFSELKILASEMMKEMTTKNIELLSEGSDPVEYFKLFKQSKSSREKGSGNKVRRMT